MTEAVRLNITRKCNLSCPYCYMDLSGEFMSLDEFDHILDAHHPSRLSLSGGEPFLHPRLFEMMKAAVGSGVRRINVVTNGTRFGHRMADLKTFAKILNARGCDVSLSLSLDALQKTQKKSGKALKALRELGYRIRVYIYPEFETEAQLSAVVTDLVEDVDECQVLFPVPMGGNESVFVEPGEWAHRWRVAANAWSSVGVKVIVQRGYSFEPFDPSPVAGPDPDSVFIDFDGAHTECCLLAEIRKTGDLPQGARCRVGEGEGCLALTIRHGSDHRLQHDERPPCPLTSVPVN